MSPVGSAEHTTPLQAGQEHPLQLETAYGICRHVARTAAKNFYYGFMVLPQRKRNALSAVYAFMRHADDICDDPGMTVDERRWRLHVWLEGYHRVTQGELTDDPVFMALHDTQLQFNIPIELLDMLVHGTGMDLQESQPMVAYRTFAELYDYCYHVASVVGLVCIRIFGYRDTAAEPLAEQVGVAFQLTNILRDIKEDAQMGRIYLPQEELDQYGIAAEELAAGSVERLRPLLQMEASRARDFYAAAEGLLPMIDDDAQPALWVLVEIYRRLLDKIEQRNYDVFSERIRLSVIEKLGVLGKGWIRRLT